MKVAKKFPLWPLGLAVATTLVATAAVLRLSDAPPVMAAVRQIPLVLGWAGAAGESEPAREQRAAYDPAPLFLPAKSGGEDVRPDALRPGAPAWSKEYSPKLKSTADSPGNLKFPGVALAPADAKAALALTERPGSTPLALGLADGNISPLHTRLAAVEAVDAGSGRIVWVAELAAADDGPRGEWRAFELMGQVAADGLAGGLTFYRGSGSAEVVNYFRERLARVERVGERLPPGLYIFKIAP